MAIGPCLCGDPYCSSCGNPSRAAYEEAIDQLMGEIEELELDEEEFDIFKAAGFGTIQVLRANKLRNKS